MRGGGKSEAKRAAHHRGPKKKKLVISATDEVQQEFGWKREETSKGVKGGKTHWGKTSLRNAT